MNKRIFILGIPIDVLSLDDTKKTIHKSLQKKSKLFIATVNASFIYKSTKNNDFKNILLKSNLNTADGVSIQLAGEYLNNLPKVLKIFRPFVYLMTGFYIGFIRFLLLNKPFKVLKTRITGIELTKYLLTLAVQRQYVVNILHRSDSILSVLELNNWLKHTYPKLKFFITPVSNDTKLSNKASLKADIYLCTLGEYSQEVLLNNLYKNNDAGIYVGIGSTFDVLTSKILSVKDIYKQRGLEWLLRLATRPKRIFKILRSVIIFPLKVYVSSL